MTYKNKIIKIIEELGFSSVEFVTNKERFHLNTMFFESKSYYHTIEVSTLKDILNLLNGKVVKCDIERRKKTQKRGISINTIDFIEYIKKRQIENLNKIAK
jgi:hypothetical protein